MAPGVTAVFKTAFYALAFSGGLYLLFVSALTFPAVQRNALYAHKANPTIWQDVSDVEAFGFLPYQVQPFTLRTPDNETLYAWHMLPLHLAEEYSQALTAQENPRVQTSESVIDTLAFKLLASDPNAHVVLNFHGNAGHLASSYRPFTYQRFLGLSSKARPVHVVAFDYRGFGLSTGTPTEEGLVTDAETVLSFLTGLRPPPSPSSETSTTNQDPDCNPRDLSIPSSNIILTSQSLGTAISTSLFHRWTLTHSLPPPKALILTSAFSSLASLIDSYSLKGVIPPLLSPFRSYPLIMNKITAHLADTWRTDTKLSQLLLTCRHEHDGPPVHIELLHAKDDREIPWWETQRLWDSLRLRATTSAPAAAAAADSTNENNDEQVIVTQDDLPITNSQDKDQITHNNNKNEKRSRMVQTWPQQCGATANKQQHQGASEVSVRFTRTRHGGHDRLACSEEAAAAVWRALER